jgi:hypothetical protein
LKNPLRISSKKDKKQKKKKEEEEEAIFLYFFRLMAVCELLAHTQEIRPALVIFSLAKKTHKCLPPSLLL